MTPFALCVLGAALCHYLGIRYPGRGYGTVKGWVASVVIGVILALLYYVYSAYGMLFSLDSLDSLF